MTGLCLSAHQFGQVFYSFKFYRKQSSTSRKNRKFRTLSRRKERYQRLTKFQPLLHTHKPNIWCLKHISGFKPAQSLSSRSSPMIVENAIAMVLNSLTYNKKAWSLDQRPQFVACPPKTVLGIHSQPPVFTRASHSKGSDVCGTRTGYGCRLTTDLQTRRCDYERLLIQYLCSYSLQIKCPAKATDQGQFYCHPKLYNAWFSNVV